MIEDPTEHVVTQLTHIIIVAVRQLFETTDFYQKVPKNRMFVNVNDAVIQALKEQRERFPEHNIKMDISEARAQVSKDPVALSPAQRTEIITNVHEEREELTQSPVTPSTQDLSSGNRKGSAQPKKSTKKNEKKKKEEISADKKKKEEPAKKEDKKKDDGKRV
ncbi:unnamed protein product [Haemonchus placei]|uniref:tRNA_bind_2 domain-containing protein n=1 Tax=Haemonchus placei TaxID=6290 RepID=A0A0N4W3C4_HAEPC|nr:unnamed protein product [Haemonchus placei]